MKILSLHAENVKKLRAVDITPTDSTVVIAGRNGQGKTSVLDSILLALAGKDAAKLMTRPIRDGQEEASVEIDLGEYRVKRTWTANDKSYLKVEAKDGTKVASPQALLDSLVGSLSFDPLSFSRLSGKQQRDALLGIVDIDLDLDHWQKSYDEVFEERTQAGRERDQIEGQLAGLPPVITDADEEVSIANLVSQLREAEGHNRDVDAEQRSLKIGEQNLTDAEEEVKRLEDELERAKMRVDGLKQSVESQRERVSTLEMKDTAALQDRIAQAEETNRQVRAGKEREVVVAKVVQARAKYDELTERLEKGRQMKADALAKATMPIEGLSIDDEGVTFKGIPFGQLSAAEQLKVSLAIAMAMNPTLRVIRILDGSLLDDGNMQVIKDMAREADFQVWIEAVRAPEDGCAIIIEDGEIVSPSR